MPYMVFLAFSAGLSYFVAGMQISVLLTLGNLSQLLALVLLWVPIFGSNSGSGISVHSLMLYVMALSLRLSSSMWLNGYLPIDATGDGVFQMIDVCSLALAVCMLRRMTDALPAGATLDGLGPLRFGVPMAFALAALVHANMDERPMFDTLWTAGHFLSSAASLPQLYLAVSDKSLESLHVTHSLLVAALGQLLVLVYMWVCRTDVTCESWIDGFNHAIWFIIAAPLAHLGIICDIVPYVLSEDAF